MLEEFEKNWQAQHKNNENKQTAQICVKKPGRPKKYISDSTPLTKTKENNWITEVKQNKKENQSADCSFKQIRIKAKHMCKFVNCYVRVIPKPIFFIKIYFRCESDKPSDGSIIFRTNNTR